MSDLQGPRVPGEERSRRGLTGGRIIAALIILAVLALLVPLTCQALGGSDTEESSQEGGSQEGTEETTSSENAAGGAAAGGSEGAQPPSGQISGLEDQSGDGTTLTVGNATLNGINGWIAVHRDDGNGNPQVPQSVGQAPLSEGENTNVVVALDEPISSSQTLHVMLHADDPADETYTFPNGDPPVEVNGEVVVEPLRYMIGGERATRGTTDGEPLPKSGGPDVLVLSGAAVLLLTTTLLTGAFLLVRRRQLGYRSP